MSVRHRRQAWNLTTKLFFFILSLLVRKPPIMEFSMKCDKIDGAVVGGESQSRSYCRDRASIMAPASRPARWSLVGSIITIFMLVWWTFWPVSHHNKPISDAGVRLHVKPAEQIIRRYNLTVGARWLNLGSFSEIHGSM